MRILLLVHKYKFSSVFQLTLLTAGVSKAVKMHSLVKKSHTYKSEL